MDHKRHTFDSRVENLMFNSYITQLPLYFKPSNFCLSGKTFVCTAIAFFKSSTVPSSCKSDILYSLPFHFTDIQAIAAMVDVMIATQQF